MQLKAILCRTSTKKQLRNAYYKITSNLLFEYQCTSGKFIRLPNRIEKKIDSVARIESKLFCPNWNALPHIWRLSRIDPEFLAYGKWAEFESIKPEVHNISLCRQMRTEPRPYVTCTKKLLKIARVVPKMWLRTDKPTQADRHAHHNTPLRYRGRSNNVRILS